MPSDTIAGQRAIDEYFARVAAVIIKGGHWLSPYVAAAIDAAWERACAAVCVMCAENVPAVPGTKAWGHLCPDGAFRDCAAHAIRQAREGDRRG